LLDDRLDIEAKKTPQPPEQQAEVVSSGSEQHIEAVPDLPGPFGSKLIDVNLSTWKGEDDAEEEFYTGADRSEAAAD
jgi:hypothetical protein